MNDPYADRVYRQRHAAKDLAYFRVGADETDLHIGARLPLQAEASAAMLEARRQVLDAIASRPRFRTSLEPLPSHGTEEPVPAAMLQAGRLASVGPMAAVAGAIAEYVGRALLSRSREIIVENGGDVFLYGRKPRVIAVDAGESPLSGLLGIRVVPETGLGVCTSSRSVGHSLSLGKTDAALVVAGNCALADAAATRLGNLVTDPAVPEAALSEICAIDGVLGALVIAGDRIGIRGNLELVPMESVT